MPQNRCSLALLGLGLAACAGSPASPKPGANGDPADTLALDRLSTASCADPAARAAAPVSPWPGLATWEDGVNDRPFQYSGSGVTVADVNNDGWPDLYLGSAGVHALFLNDGAGAFTAAPADALPSAAPHKIVGGFPGDADGDGDVDLFIATMQGPDALWLNDGNGRFSDGTAAAGLPTDDAQDTTGAAWRDLDGDGWLDLLVTGYYEGPLLLEYSRTGDFPPAPPNRIFRNTGGGVFAEVTDLPARLTDGYTFVLAPLDVDGDHVDELYVVNDFGRFATENVLFRAEGGAWAEDAGPHGLGLQLFGMSLSVGDLNDDGIWDLLISSWGEMALLESTGADWYRSDRARGLTLGPGQMTAWGTALEDVDNDLDLDAWVSYGPVDSPPEVHGEVEETLGVPVLYDQPDALYVQGADGTFADAAPAYGLDGRAIGRGAAWVDLNGDGWLDLVHRDLDGPTQLHQSACGEAGGLVVRLRDSTGPNTRAIGATVEVEVGGRVLSRRVFAGGESFASAGEGDVHFGLGSAPAAEVLRVRWPDGEVQEAFGVGPGRVTATR